MVEAFRENRVQVSGLFEHLEGFLVFAGIVVNVTEVVIQHRSARIVFHAFFIHRYGVGILALAREKQAEIVERFDMMGVYVYEFLEYVISRSVLLHVCVNKAKVKKRVLVLREEFKRVFKFLNGPVIIIAVGIIKPFFNVFLFLFFVSLE